MTNPMGPEERAQNLTQYQYYIDNLKTQRKILLDSDLEFEARMRYDAEQKSYVAFERRYSPLCSRELYVSPHKEKLEELDREIRSAEFRMEEIRSAESETGRIRSAESEIHGAGARAEGRSPSSGGRLRTPSEQPLITQELEEEAQIVTGSGTAETGCAANLAVAIIVAGLVTVATIALLFTPGSPVRVSGDGKSKKKSTTKDAKAENAFAISDVCFQIIDDLMSDIYLRDEWLGTSSTNYADNNAGFASSARQAAAASREVDATVRTQAEQVEKGRGILVNAFDGLQLAMPVSESLYFSGPAGPALSYSFQLAVTNAGVGASIDTTNTMHENSQKHAKRLLALSQQYNLT